ncbi:hypothetical protein [Methanolobus psychrotolerans]|uniref:hypothetical protein n=1 Tax=Methanolobus psychrotolerans TaxID=1874706 RepID=UPI000B917B1F|nr:hypothetical protein [Methanolobus psychrotolerans]
MAQEQGIAKVDLTYIYKAVMMGNSLYSDNWEKGVLYLTNLNLWFSEGGGWITIPLKSITMVGREVTDPIRMKAQRTIGTSHVLMIDYLQPSSVVEGATASATALLAGNEAVINTLKTYLQPMCGTPPKKQSLTDVDKKLLYMLYTGVNDLQKLVFFIGVDNDTLTNSFKSLREQNLCDTSGTLTEQGQKQIREMM